MTFQNEEKDHREGRGGLKINRLLIVSFGMIGFILSLWDELPDLFLFNPRTLSGAKFILSATADE